MFRIAICFVALMLSIGSWLVTSANSAENEPSVQTAWRLLDYIAVDYSVAVDYGQIIDELEYAEMVEFANAVEAQLADLPTTTSHLFLTPQVDALKAAIDQKASATKVSKIARALADELLATYPLTLAPALPPDIARGISAPSIELSF